MNQNGIETNFEEMPSLKEEPKSLMSEDEMNKNIPPFWTHEPRAWFAQLEAFFNLANVTADNKKYCHVVTRLDKDSALEVKEIILNEALTEKYENIKTALITRLSESKEKKIHQQMIEEEIGDRKPSEFLNHLQRIAGAIVPEAVIKAVWYASLPNKIQDIVILQGDASLESVAKLADCVFQAMPAQVLPAKDAVQLEDLTKKMDDLTKVVGELSSLLKTRGRSRSHESQGLRNRGRGPHCWYHHNFGVNAVKCLSPCNFNAVF